MLTTIRQLLLIEQQVDMFWIDLQSPKVRICSELLRREMRILCLRTDEAFPSSSDQVVDELVNDPEIELLSHDYFHR